MQGILLNGDKPLKQFQITLSLIVPAWCFWNAFLEMDAFTIKEEKATREVIFSYNTGEKAEMEKLFF